MTRCKKIKKDCVKSIVRMTMGMTPNEIAPESVSAYFNISVRLAKQILKEIKAEKPVDWKKVFALSHCFINGPVFI